MIKRNDAIDILKGIGIILMVFDHIGFGNMVHTYIQSFHMLLFFIVSGYFYIGKKNYNILNIKKNNMIILFMVSIVLAFCNKCISTILYNSIIFYQ